MPNRKLREPGLWIALLLGLAILFWPLYLGTEQTTVERSNCIPTVVVSADNLCKPS